MRCRNSRAGGRSAVGWADKQLLFINDYLVDPAVPRLLWSYHNLDWTGVRGGHVWFLAVDRHTDVALVPLRLPQPAIQAKLASARAGVPPLLLQSGDPVQVDVSQLPPEHQRDAQRTLEERLRHFDYRPAANAAVKLEARLGKERERKTTYTGGKSPEEVTTRVVEALVCLRRDGKELWSQKVELTRGPPMMVFVKSGQSVASKVGGSSIPDYDRLKVLELPGFVQPLQQGKRPAPPCGNSYVRTDGIR